MFRWTAVAVGILVAAGAGSAAEGLRLGAGDRRLVAESPPDPAAWQGRGISVEILHPDARPQGLGTVLLSEPGARNGELESARFGTLTEDWGAHFMRRKAGRGHLGALPGRSIGGVVGSGIGEGWDLQLGLRRTSYGLANTEVRLVRAERTLGDHRFAYTRFALQSLTGGSVPSYRLQWSYLVGERASVGLARAAGREFDGDMPGSPGITDVRDTMIFGRYWFRSDWAFSAEGISHEQGEWARRYGLRLGLQHRF